MANQDVVKFGDTFYLKHESGQYLIPVDRGRYNWPQLGNTGKVKLELVGGKGEVQSNSRIKIRTTESVTGHNDILGAFVDSHDCYYWRDGYDNDKQSWQIVKVSPDAGSIRYGDRVYLTNCSYTTQKLSADTSNRGYITTAENAKDSWILESTVEQSITQSASVQPSTSKALRVFNWSVASGDPTESGVILWTRVNPEAFDKTTPLKYQVASDQNFQSQSIVLEDQVNASQFGVERDYTVHIDLDGKLEANTSYFYRFIYKDISSPIGRCKTLPAAIEPEFNKLRLAVLTCNDYSTGYFNAFYELAKEDVDFVIHLGDFAYEYPQYPPGYGEIIRTDLQLEAGEGQYEPKGKSGGKRATTLANFRHIYRTYREDPALQAAMEKHTWIVILDDHEIADDAYWDYDRDTLGTHPSHAIYENYYYYGPEDEDFDKKKKDYYEGYEGDREKISPEDLEKMQLKCRQEMLRLYKEATQAWKEYVPVRVRIKPGCDGSHPHDYQMYRQFRFGSLVDFFLTDSRTYRDKPEQTKNAAIVEAATDLKAEHPEITTAERIALARTINNAGQTPSNEKWSMLGPDQKQWLLNGITSSNASWRVWGNQTLLATSKLVEMKGHDDWHGFKAERYEILQTIKDRETARQGSNEVSRFVVFTGDMHTSLIAYLKTDFEEDFDPFEGQWSWNPLDLANNKMNRNYDKLVGVEFMTPGVTSPGISEGIYAAAAGLEEKLGGKLEDWVIGKGTLKAVSETLSPVTETASAAASAIAGTASSILGTATSALGSLVPDAVENALGSVTSEASPHKLVTGNLIKGFSPHIEHFDSGVNGYAIAEFTPDELKWSVYHVNTTDYDKLDDGQGSNVRNVSTNRVQKQLVQSATYQPNGISLDD